MTILAGKSRVQLGKIATARYLEPRMPTEDQLHIVLAETKTQRLIEIANSLVAIDSQIRQHIDEAGFV